MHGRVAIFIYKAIPTKTVIKIPLQAVASTVNMGRKVAVVTTHNFSGHHINKQILIDLFQQVPKPVTLTGDFNSYHEF